MVARARLKPGDFERLRRRLNDTIPEAVREEVEKAIVQGAEEIADTARRFAPERSGNLKKSIVVTKPGHSTPAHSQPGGTKTVGPLSAAVTAGNSDVRYAHLVEYGTKPHEVGGIFEGAQHPGSVARPFFWPAYRLHRKKVKARVKRAIGKALRKKSGV
ncbi:HK97-gp10 family putative phage morphogenesis protein [Acuticoccus sediminis]|uniref:HK97-gp10 family putative phage morphogenesis protein n=1 Tax=Acuticoccus sediminis TaxID=2184697 RepID=UPI001CFE45E0|nr:HK97-gp10 family putative phage morphogenesis protein [Acuticoccus sediminis]